MRKLDVSKMSLKEKIMNGLLVSYEDFRMGIDIYMTVNKGNLIIFNDGKEFIDFLHYDIYKKNKKIQKRLLFTDDFHFSVLEYNNEYYHRYNDWLNSTGELGPHSRIVEIRKLVKKLVVEYDASSWPTDHGEYSAPSCGRYGAEYSKFWVTNEKRIKITDKYFISICGVGQADYYGHRVVRSKDVTVYYPQGIYLPEVTNKPRYYSPYEFKHGTNTLLFSQPIKTDEKFFTFDKKYNLYEILDIDKFTKLGLQWRDSEVAEFVPELLKQINEKKRLKAGI